MNIQKKSCIIIDDDKFASETLSDLLSDSNIDILKIISDSKTAIKDIAILKPDLVFLDINMPDKNGLKILNEVNELGITSKVIFVTSYHEYVLDALKENAFDYLIKPIKKQELDESLNRFFNSNNKLTSNDMSENQTPTVDKNKIAIKNAHGTLLLKTNDIIYIEAEGCYTNLHLTSLKTELISRNIGSIEELFMSEVFFKISRSIIINLNFLVKINRLKRLVYLTYQGKQFSIKASKERLYNLESFINKR